MPDRPSRSLWYAACQPSEGHRGINERLGDLHRLGGGQRGVELIQPIRSLADGVEWNFRSELLQEGQRAEKVCRLTSPPARISRCLRLIAACTFTALSPPSV